MPKYKSHFKEEWKETYPWITNFQEDTTRAFCRLCNSDFSVATTGEIQVKDHAGRDKHIKKQKQYSKQTTLLGKPSAITTTGSAIPNSSASSSSNSSAPATLGSSASSSSADAPVSVDNSPVSVESVPVSVENTPVSVENADVPASASSATTTKQHKQLSLGQPMIPSLYFESGEKVTRAEIIRSLDLLDKNISFRAADNDNYMFSKMFPDRLLKNTRCRNPSYVM